jgi:hypothetical protein
MEDFMQLSDRGSSKDIATSNTLHTSRQSVQGCFKPEEGKVLIFSRFKDIYDLKFSTKQAAVKAGSDCDSLFALRKQQPSEHIYESGKPNSKGMMMISEKNTYRYSDGRKAAAAFNASTTSAVL